MPGDAERISTLAELALRCPGATGVLRRLGLDFCCHGTQTLAEACADRGLEVEAVVARLRSAAATAAGRAEPEAWDRLPIPRLLDRIVARYHQSHRRQLPSLLQLATTVERVHVARDDCPRGLAADLQRVAAELESHMQKEEDILFPMLRAGHGRHAAGPIQVMEQEHRDHGANLARLRQLTRDFAAPAGACATWQELYRDLEQFEDELMQHIHLENHVLFPRVLNQ